MSIICLDSFMVGLGDILSESQLFFKKRVSMGRNFAWILYPFFSVVINFLSYV
jgi:hypothetical protein